MLDVDLAELPSDGVQRLPRDFGSYRLMEEIGRGGMGVVYRAEHVGLRRIVAIKLLLAGAHASEVMLLRFRREAAAVAALQHPNIIAIHDYGEVDGQPFYTMDWVAGRDLAAYCAGRPLRPHQAAEILRVVAEAVQHAHARGVIHRDLKPSNVLIDASGQARLADFGLAKHLGSADDITVAGQMLGSPNYVPPEQATAGATEHGVASDVYGLGALFYHLLTGRAPFNAATPTETLRLVLETEPAPPHLLHPGLPRDLETICTKCLAKVPSQRYSTAGAVADELQRFLEHRPILARPPGWIDHTRKFVRRHRVGVATSVVAFCLLAVVATGVLVSLLRERAALARALSAEQGQAAARRQAGEFAAFMIGDIGLTMKRYGNSAMLLRIAEQTDAYYRQLPPDLRDRASRIRHADALEQIASVQIWSRGEYARGITAMRQAVALREAIATEDPADPDIASVLIWAQWELAWWSGDTRSSWDPAWRNGIAQKLRDIRGKHPECHPATGCLAWVLCANGKILARDPARVRDGLALLAEGNALADLWEQWDDASLDAENHRYATIQGCRSMLAIGLSAAGDDTQALAVQEECLAKFTAAWQNDTGHLMLRDLVGQSALGLCSLAIGSSPRRVIEAEALARTHYQALLGLDPENVRFFGLFLEAHAHSPEAYRCLGDWRAAKNALLAWDDAYDTIKAHAPTWSPDFRYAELPVWIAEACARLGDASEARRWIAEVKPRLDDQLRIHADQDGPLERARAAQNIAHVAVLVPGWPDAATLVEDAREAIDALHAARPADPELIQRSAIMQGFAGVLLARENNVDGAAMLIARAVSSFSSSQTAPPRLDYPSVRRTIMDSWCDVLARTGRLADAVATAEAMVTHQEAECTRHPGHISAREFLAADLVRLASLLHPVGPETAARQHALLLQASALMASARSNGAWQTVSDDQVAQQLTACLGPSAEVDAQGAVGAH